MKKKKQQNIQPSRNIDDIDVYIPRFEDEKSYIDDCNTKIIDGEKMYYCSCGGYLWYVKEYNYFVCGDCRKKYYK